MEVDEKLMETYLEQGDVKAEQLHAPFEQALRDGHLVPVCFVSARSGAGVKELLDILARLMPNPAEGNPPLFYKGEGDAATEIRAEPDPKKHVLAHVFKIVVDPFVGKLAAFRVFQGTLRRDLAACLSATAANRSKSSTCSCCRAKSTSKPMRACRAISPR